MASIAAVSLAALGAFLAVTGCEASNPASPSPTTSSTSAVPTTTATTAPPATVITVPPCVADPTMPGCQRANSTLTRQIYVRNPGCPYAYIDSNTGMLVVSAPNGQTYDVPTNDGYYYVQPDGSVTVPY